MRGYDEWLSREPWIDAPLHEECSTCFVKLTTYHEEVEGRCKRCEALDEREREEREEVEAELKGAA